MEGEWKVADCDFFMPSLSGVGAAMPTVEELTMMKPFGISFHN